MESKQNQNTSTVVTQYDDDYEITKKDYQKKYPAINGTSEFIPLDRNNILIVGQSQSGKTLLLNNMLIKYFLHVIKPQRIYIFSKTASFDLTYRPVLKYIVEQDDTLLHIYESIDMDTVRIIVNKQKELQKINMTMKADARLPVE